MIASLVQFICFSNLPCIKKSFTAAYTSSPIMGQDFLKNVLLKPSGPGALESGIKKKASLISVRKLKIKEFGLSISDNLPLLNDLPAYLISVTITCAKKLDIKILKSSFDSIRGIMNCAMYVFNFKYSLLKMSLLDASMKKPRVTITFLQPPYFSLLIHITIIGLL